MHALSPMVGAAIGALLLASVARALLGRPARRPRRALARALLVATAACYVAGAALALAGAVAAGTLLVVAGVEASCLGAWLVRGDDDEPGDADPGPSPWDWDAFDRARVAWGARRGQPAPPPPVHAGPRGSRGSRQPRLRTR